MLLKHSQRILDHNLNIHTLMLAGVQKLITETRSVMFTVIPIGISA